MSTVEEGGSLRSNRDEDDDGIVEEEESSDEGGDANNGGDTTARPTNTGEEENEKVDQGKEKETFGIGEMPGSFTPSSQSSDFTEMSASILSQPLNDNHEPQLGTSTSTINTSNSSSSSSSKSSNSVSSDQKPKLINHVASPSLGLSTISTDSRTSFYSAISDSESSSNSTSDIRSGKSGKSHLSGKSDDTNPTTDDGDGSGEIEESSSSSPKRSIETDANEEGGEIRPERLIGISQKNESQTTIRREGSSGTIGTRNNSNNRISTTTPLPTHHESPGSPEAEEEGITPVKTSETILESDQDQTVSQTSNPNSNSNSNPNSNSHSNSTSIDETQRASNSSPIAAIPLTKRHSQSSSKGHHRTPSRTKRRSLSSGALSDHNPPSLASRPVDYISLMTQLQPAIFSTTLEQNLLHQLSSLGMDVGQIVHSIVNDACDASGAMWWLLKRKAEEREAYAGGATGVPNESSTNPVIPSTSTHVEAPPVPPKDPNRRSSKEELNAATSTLQPQSTRDGLPKGAQDSFRRRLDASTIQALAGISSEEERGRRRSVEDSKALRSSSHSEIPTEDGSATTTTTAGTTIPTSTSGGPSTSSLDHLSASTRGETSSPESSTTGHKNSTKAKAGASKLSNSEIPKPKRNRTNSFSMRQLTGKLGGGGGSSNVPTVKVGEDELPMERAKSPVSNLFGKRNTQSVLSPKSQSPTLEDKKDERKLTPSKVTAALMAERLSSPNPKSSSPSPSSKATARSPRGTDRDFDRLKAVASMGTSSEHASPTRISSKAASRLGGAPSPAEVQAASQLTNSESVETFSTLDSSDGHEREDSGPSSSTTSRKEAKSRTKSSFLSTVRTWLGSEDKQTRKQRKGMTASASGSKLATKGPSSSLGHSGPGSASQSVIRNGSVRARASPYQAASPSTLSRRSTAASGTGPRSPTQRGSLGRRGSTGSAHLIALLDGKVASPPSRPPNYRRQSAGSITPTATMYGDVNWELGGSLSGSAVRGSRPSSSQSMRRGPLSGSLHAKTGSASSSGSLMRLQQQAAMGGHHHHLSSQASGEYAGSLRGLHGRRPSDGSTTVRRHRPYTAPHGGNSRRASSVASRGSSPGPSEAGDSTNDTDLVAMNSGRGSARTSLDSQGKPRSPVASFSPTFQPSGGIGSNNHSHSQSHSVFVAHKSRSPFKPPSANPSIHGLAQRASVSSHAHSRRGSENGNKQLANSPPTASTTPAPATWRRSWGRPPPSWVGTIDDQPTTEELIAANKPKLRDVFAAKEGEDEWVDEDEEPSYSGGLGQLSSINASNNSSNQMPFGSSGFSNYGSNARGGIADSPFSNKTSRTEASNIFGNKNASSNTSFSSMSPFSSSPNMSGGLLSSGRYAGVRSLFQPPSLGREISPKMLSISNNPITSTSTGSSLLNSTPAVEEEQEGIEKGVESDVPTASETSNLNPGGTTRRGAQPPAFKQITIEEEEEDE